MELGLLIFHGSSGELVRGVSNRQKSFAETQCHDKCHLLNYLGICKELSDVIKAIQKFFHLLDALEDSNMALNSFVPILNEGSGSYS